MGASRGPDLGRDNMNIMEEVMEVKCYKSNGYKVGGYDYLHNLGGYVVNSWSSGHPHYIVL